MEEPCSSFINVLTPNIFEKIQSSSSTKEARDILAKCYTRGDKVRKVKLQALRRQYELLQMGATERVADYITRVLNLANQMKGCGKKITEQMIIEKIMRTLIPCFDYIGVAIEESKDIEVMKVKELQGSLEAQELRLIQRGVVKPAE